MVMQQGTKNECFSQRKIAKNNSVSTANDNMAKHYKLHMYTIYISHDEKLPVIIADSDRAIAIIKLSVSCICKFYFNR
jgi:hypothetical protein